MASGPLVVKLEIKADGTAAIVGLNKVQGALDTTGKKGKEASAGINSLSSSLQSLAMTAGSVVSVAALARSFITANIEAEKLSKGLTLIAGSAVSGAAEMAYVSAQADRMGISVAAAGTAYLSLAAAAKGTAIEGQGARDAFEAVTLAMGKLGASSADVQGAMMGLWQVVSNATVNMEDLRQVTDRIPGGMKAAAESMGYTTGELKELVSESKIMSSDAIPALTAGLNKLYDDGKAISGLTAEWNKFNNALGASFVALNNATGATNILAGALANAASNAKALASWMNNEGWNNFATEQDRGNYLLGERIRLTEAFTAKAKEVNQKSSWGSLWLDDSEAELRAIGNELGQVTQKMAKMGQSAKDAGVADTLTKDRIAAENAADMGNEMVASYREREKEQAKHIANVEKIVGSYDKQAAKASLVKDKEAELNAAVAAKTITQDKANDILKKYTAGLEESGKKAGGAGKAHATAAKAAKEYTTDLDALIKRFLPARDDAEKLAEATDLIADAHAKGDLVGKDYTEMVKKVAEAYDTATNDAQKLIDKYDTEGAKARELAEDRAKLAAVLADGTLKVEGASKAMDKLTEAEKKNNSEADAWTEVWKNAVKRIDDTFANLWEDLFSGGKSALDSLKRAITSWLAEVAHALLTKPLVVAITAGMTGGVGTASAATGAVNAVSGVGSGFSSLTNFGSLASSIYSLGSTFLSGIAEGFAGMFSTNMFSTLGGAFGAMGSGSATGFAAGLGVAMPYLLPVIAVAGGILAKYFADQKPRYGAYAATTHGGTGQFEDSVGVKGAFGLTFGMNDKGSANIDAEESRAVFEGFAKVSEAMAQFYGADVSAQVEASLKKISEEYYAKTGIINYAMDASQAFDVAFTQIIDAAAATGDSVAVVMKAIVGDLSGTAEEMAGQIEAAMNTTSAVIQVAKSLEGTDTGKLLELGTDLTANALRLVDYANAIKWTGETTAAALGRMGQYITVLNTALDLSGNTVDVTGQAFVDLARNLAYAADVAKIGIEGLLQLQSYYFDQFFSAEDKFTRNIEAASKTITDSFKDLNIMPTRELKLGTTADPLLVKDRQAFVDLINGLDLTTESGRKLYVELMKLTPAFDAIFDGVEAFMGWLKPQDQGDALAQMTEIFKGWGLQLPATRMELEKLVASGGLTTEQMAILGGLLAELGLVFGDVADTAKNVTDKLAAAAQQNADLQLRLAEAKGDDALALKLRREQELKGALDATNRALLEQIYLLEDAKEAMNKAYAALERAVAEERKKIEATYQARVDAINAEREAINKQMSAAQEALSKVSGVISSIQSALASFRDSVTDNDIALATARRKLAAWAAGGILPQQDNFDRVMASLNKDDKGNYANAVQFKVSQQGIYANLLELERLGLKQKTDAEKQLDALDKQLSALDKQLEQAEDWKNKELERLDGILEDAKKRMEIALGTYQELQSIDEAMKQLNKAMEDYLKAKTPVPIEPIPQPRPIPIIPTLRAVPTGELYGGQVSATQAQTLQDLKTEISAMRLELVQVGVTQTVALKSMDERLIKWDLDGSPPWRDEGDGTTATLLKVA